MSFVDGKCPLCGSRIKIPEGQARCFCTSCGQQIASSAAIAFASDSEASQASRFQVVQGEASMPTSGGIATPDNIVANIEPTLQTEVKEKNGLLEQWKQTPMGFAVLGLLFPVPGLLTSGIGYLLYSALIANASFTAAVVGLLVPYLVYVVISVIYALKIYPSLITENPKLKSHRVAAYLNTAFGGIIFGSIWCSAITKRRKTTSQYVYVGLMVIASIALAALYSGQIMGASSNTAVPNETAKTYEVIGYIEPDDSEWSSASGTVSISSSSVSFIATAGSKQLSEKGSYIGEDQGIAMYETGFGTYIGYAETQGVKMLMMLTDDDVLYCLQIE